MSEGTRLQPLRDWWLEWVMIPDWQAVWLPWAVGMGLQVIRREKIEVIVSTSGPETNHLVGMWLSRLTGVPLVVDFRDGWLFESLKPFMQRNSFRRVVDGWLERQVVSQSSAVVTVSDPLTAYFRQTYGLSESRTVTIPNGYGPEDWWDVQPAARTDGRFRLVHTGAFSHSRHSCTPLPLLQGLTRLPHSLRQQIEVLLVGNVRQTERQLAVDLDLADVVQWLPPVTRVQSLGYQLSADVLLLMVGTDRSVATSKLFEYLYARRPILAIGRSGTAACQIVQRVQAGLVADPENPDAVASALIGLFDLWRSGGLGVYGQGDISMYDRRFLAGQLAAVFDRVISAGRR